jgi:hypothetical protein
MHPMTGIAKEIRGLYEAHEKKEDWVTRIIIEDPTLSDILKMLQAKFHSLHITASTLEFALRAIKDGIGRDESCKLWLKLVEETSGADCQFGHGFAIQSLTAMKPKRIRIALKLIESQNSGPFMYLVNLSNVVTMVVKYGGDGISFYEKDAISQKLNYKLDHLPPEHTHLYQWHCAF